MALPPETGRTIASYALKKAGITGVGRAPNATQLTDALVELNDMIAQWNTDRLMVWALLDLGFTSTGTTAGYTVGPGAQYACNPRPNRIEAAYVRQFNTGFLPVDRPLKVIPAREQYSRIATKQLVSFPEAVFFDTSHPEGRLFPYPAPTAGVYEVHILVKNVAPQFDADTLAADVPSHYLPCMKYNLARRLRQMSGKGRTPDIELNRLANGALETVKNSNLQVPELVMPPVLVNNGLAYNIYNDTNGNA